MKVVQIQEICPSKDAQNTSPSHIELGEAPSFSQNARHSRQLFEEDFSKLRIAQPIDLSSRVQLLTGPDKLARGELKKVLLLARELGTDPAVRQTAWESLFSGLLGERLARAFPLLTSGLSENNLRKAVVLSEVGGTYSGSLGGHQFERAAAALVRLEGCLLQPHGELRTKAPQTLFNELTLAAFGTTDRHELGARYSLSELRGFQLGFLDFIASIATVNREGARILRDPKLALAEELSTTPKDIEFDGEVFAEILPYAVVFYLEERDFHSFKPNSVLGFFIPESADVTELSGKIAVVKRTKEEKDVNDTRRHELRHHFFHQYFRRGYCTALDIAQELKQLSPTDLENEYRAHVEIARKVFFNLVDTGRDEIVAYSEEAKALNRSVDSFMTKFWWSALAYISDHLSKRSDLDVQEKHRIGGCYKKAYAEFLEWLCHARILTHRMYANADEEGAKLSGKKIEALFLALGPLEFVRVGPRYLGLNRAGFARVVTQEQNGAVAELHKVVKGGSAIERALELDTYSHPLLSAVCGIPARLNPKNSWKERTLMALSEVQSLHPPASLPDVIGIICIRRDTDVVNSALLALHQILAVQGESLAKDTLQDMKDILQARFKHFQKSKHPAVAENIQTIISQVETLLSAESFPFPAKREVLELAKLVAAPLGKEPTLAQIKSLCERLPTDDEKIWLKVFNPEYLSSLAAEASHEAIGVLLLISERCPEPTIKDSATRLFQRRILFRRGSA